MKPDAAVTAAAFTSTTLTALSSVRVASVPAIVMGTGLVICHPPAAPGFKSGTLESIDNFVTMMRMFSSELDRKNAYDVAVLVGKHTGIVKELFNDKTTEGLARYENVQELLNSIKELQTQGVTFAFARDAVV